VPTPTSPRLPKTPRLDVAIERGPKGKRYVAVAREWPGLERGGTTPEAAIEALLEHVPRYQKIATLARYGAQLKSETSVRVVEEYAGVGSTDFWGISFAFSTYDERPMSKEEMQRELALMRACWKYFDHVRLRVSAELQKGARGGGRDRDRITEHVIGVEQDWATKLAIRTSKDPIVIDNEGLKQYRDVYCKAIRDFHAQGKKARTWPLRYLIRHTAYHTLDHAWEMENKDLSNRTA
jgi:hypothetical protein